MSALGDLNVDEVMKDDDWELESMASFEDACEAYTEAIYSHCAGFYQIGEGICVTGAWDLKKQQGKWRAGWFHVTFRRQEASSCIHKWFFAEYEKEWFPGQDWDIITNKAIMITREQTDSENWYNVFSVGLEKEPSQAVITHSGKDDGGRRWTCNKSCSSMSSCPHIAKARVALPCLLSGDPDAEEGSGVAYMGLEVERGKEHNCAVSHLPIRPPRWAAFPTDAALYPYPPPILVAPELIVLDQQSACPYHDEKVFWDGSGEIVKSPCLVYTLGPPKYHAVPRDHSSWHKTGACYSLPQIRNHLSYPKLPWDKKQKKSEVCGDKCSKFYGSYCGRTLSGGLMIMWCKHSICYGFHCIQEAEGCDDVFSAIVTHWPKAPHHIIYDFACALGPYCMLREPDFFADTQFMVDAFHAQGHTKCSSASMVQNYSKVDPCLDGVNSSAAECGNGMLGRIRKSMSYMGQQRAILYTKVFLSVVNRVKILKMSLGNLWG
ncbi:hypothetical protein C8J56DRAFT_1062435 [Mycena floridula]|nr:hypothetical protein C8J56DRAFT_1062435 [Mycena floridula]